MPKFYKTKTVTPDMIRQEDVILFEIQKSEVKKADFSRVDGLISALNECGKDGRGKIGLSFAYDDDRRELCEIPEVVSCVKQLFAMCPHLVYFLFPDVNTVRAFLFCLSDAKVGDRSGGMTHMDVDKGVFIRNAEKIADSVRAYGMSVNDAAGSEALLGELGF